MEADSLSHRVAEDTLKSQLAETHRMLATERTAREKLQAESAMLHAKLNHLYTASYRLSMELQGAKIATVDTWSKALNDIAAHRLAVGKSTLEDFTYKEDLKNEVEELRRALNERTEEVQFLSQARRSDESAMLDATRCVMQSDKQASQWQRRTREAETARRIADEQQHEASSTIDHLRRELLLAENLLACAEAMPKQYRGTGVQPKGSWREPAFATGTEEQRAVVLVKRAESSMREHAMLGYGASMAIRMSLRRAIGKARAEELLHELKLDVPSRKRFQVASSDASEHCAQIDTKCMEQPWSNLL